MRPDARIAVYYAPRPDDPLDALASAWLGRDAATDSAVAQPGVTGIAEVTAEPRLYGFHATLKPPMRLAVGRDWDEFVAAATALARDIAPFEPPALAVQDLHGFLALRETTASASLQSLADVCVERLDAFRAPPSEAELARRRRSNLSPRQDEMLVRWGYPYVFDTWFFHLTLTRRLSAAERQVFMPAAEAHFAPATTMPRLVSDICLFVQEQAGSPFVIRQRLPLRG